MRVSAAFFCDSEAMKIKVGQDLIEIKNYSNSRLELF